MHISSTRNSVFFENEREPRKGRNFKVVPTDRNQFTEAPDWLLKNSYFNQCVSDGSVVVVEVKSAPPAPKKGVRQLPTPGMVEPAVRVNEPPPEPEPELPTHKAGEIPGLQDALEGAPEPDAPPTREVQGVEEPGTREQLEDMSKVELIAYAKRKFKLKLDPTDRKGELVDAVEAAMTDPTAGN